MSGPMPVGSHPGPVSGPVQVATRLLVGRTGMRVTEGLKERLAACLDGAARASGRTPEGYAAGLAGDPGAFQELLDCVTVQESGFFRHPDQFTALAREVLPSLEGPVVVWSAGCANGQEAYSLAMELAASGRPDWRCWPPTSRPPRWPGPGPAATRPPSWPGSLLSTGTGSGRPATSGRSTRPCAAASGSARPTSPPGSRPPRAAARSCSAATCSST